MIPYKKILKKKQVVVVRNAVRSYVHKTALSSRIIHIFVYLPTILAALYLLLIHSNMYISESRFALRSSDSAEMNSPISGLFMSMGSSSSVGMDTHIVLDHIKSMHMLDKIQQRINVFEHYSSRANDIYSRLKSHPTREEFLKYWEKAVTVVYQQDKGIVTVLVKAYSPEMAKAINDAVLESSEELVNQMNNRSHQDSITLTKKEVAEAEQRVQRAQAALQGFRDKEKILDPSLTAQSREAGIAKMENEVASLQTDLKAALSVMKADSPSVKNIRTRIKALTEQVEAEKARLAGIGPDGGTLSSLVGDYATLITEETFAQNQLIKAMAAFESARLKAISQSIYIVPYQPPTLPEESEYPKPFLAIVLIFLSLLIIVGIMSLIIAAIKDHIGC